MCFGKECIRREAARRQGCGVDRVQPVSQLSPMIIRAASHLVSRLACSGHCLALGSETTTTPSGTQLAPASSLKYSAVLLEEQALMDWCCRRGGDRIRGTRGASSAQYHGRDRQPHRQPCGGSPKELWKECDVRAFVALCPKTHMAAQGPKDVRPAAADRLAFGYLHPMGNPRPKTRCGHCGALALFCFKRVRLRQV